MSDDIDRSNWSQADHDAESFGEDLVEFTTGESVERVPTPTPDHASSDTKGLGAWMREQPGFFGFLGLALLLLILVAFAAFVMSVLGESDEDSHPGTDAAPVYSGGESEDSAVAVWGEEFSVGDGEKDADTPSQDQDIPTSSSTPSNQPVVPVPDDFPVPIALSGKVVEYNDDDQGTWTIAVYPFDQFDQLVDFYAKWLEDEGYTVDRQDQGFEDYPAVWFSAFRGPEGDQSLSVAVTGDRPNGDVTVMIHPGAEIKASP